MNPWRLYVVVTSLNLWFFARLAGLRIRSHEIVAMQRRNTNVRQVIRLLLEAKRAGLTVSVAEVEERIRGKL